MPALNVTTGRNDRHPHVPRLTLAHPPTAAPALPRSAAATARVRPRLVFIDEARGVFLWWMIVSHAMTLAQLPDAHPLQWLRPRGWASTGFIVVAGFTLAVVSTSDATTLTAMTRRLRRRAWQLGLVAVVSNVLFLLAREQLAGRLTADAALAIATLRVPWSISGALVPIAAAIALAPAAIGSRWVTRGSLVLALATACVLALDLTARAAPDAWRATTWFQALIGHAAARGGAPPYLPFPLARYTLLAIWGFAFGIFAASSGHRRWASAGLVSAGLLTAASQMTWLAPLVPAAHVVVVLVLVRLAAHWPGLAGPRAALALLGRAALVVFLLHRVLLQAGVLVLGRSLAPVPLTVTLIGLTLPLCLLAALAWDGRRALAWLGPAVRRSFSQTTDLRPAPRLPPVQPHTRHQPIGEEAENRSSAVA